MSAAAVRPRVLVNVIPPGFHELVEPHADIVSFNDLSPSGNRIDGVYVYGAFPVNATLLARLEGVRIVSNFGVGVDHIDVAAVRECGARVANTPGVLDAATADLGFALLMAAGRRIAEGDRFARGPRFLKYEPSDLHGREIHGAVLGIVGMGRIGRQIARRAAGFDMRVLYHNRRRDDEAEQTLGVEYVALDALLQQSDYVILCVPLTPETRGLIGRDQLARMKPTATLINIARGAVIDLAALTDALQHRTIYAAALDVTDPEPLPRDHPILQLDSLTITPHLGSATVQTRRRMLELSVEQLLAGLRGEPLRHEVVA